MTCASINRERKRVNERAGVQLSTNEVGKS